MPKDYNSGKIFKYSFFAIAALIAIASVWITNHLVDELKEEERKKIENWAEAIKVVSSQASFSEDTDSEAFNNYDELVLGLLLKLLQGNTTIPVIVTDNNGVVNTHNNLQVPEQGDSLFLAKKIKAFAAKHEPILIELDDDFIQYVYYDDSSVLKQLQWFPFIQLAVVFILMMISFLALNNSKKAEQNKVWVGLSKETAHQLGTPISSLMAWVEYLKTKDMDIMLLDEMDKDVHRLKVIAERFSKIGSNPEPEPMNLLQEVENAVAYLGKRISSKVNVSIDFPEEEIIVLMNDSLFGWTMENLIKNAVDAMDGQGSIAISAQPRGNKVIIDVTDTGKGIPKSKFDAVFHPGYTTKKRGWGLGLSLVKRIVESYHKGKIYVHKSEPGKGTTFRIELNRQDS
ncbi:HAMP domain-containing histidine kinase [Bacteroidales bacterium OttesenSCG-928-J19]|nr:HAMP domain-containing histidine kinase [Bacteroidales bacterium OttesenSCG-928-J19]